MIGDARHWVARFRDAWQHAGEPPAIDRHLPDEPAARRTVLRELICIDLQFRYGVELPRPASTPASAIEPLRLEDYVARFPELGPVGELPCELICAEYSARVRAGFRPAREEYASRFGHAADELQSWLDDVDRRFPGETVNLEASSMAADEDSTIPGLGSAPGTTFAPERPRFSVLDLHARGGLGEVYAARDEQLDRVVALKQIRSTHADDDRFQLRFLREARINGSLEHPNIVPVYALDRFADGRPYYAMRFVRGVSLQEKIEQFYRGRDSAPAAESAVAFRRLLREFLDVCEAIGYAHSRGIVHRDLKPANIMVGDYGETFVVDWGLAKSRKGSTDDDQAERERLVVWAEGADETVVGQPLGTPAYMSPEQAMGEHDRVDERADVYSLGATLYVILTGTPPFSGPVTEVMENVKRGALTRPRLRRPEVPRALEAICLKSMALRPGDRYESVRAFAGDIEHYLADEAVSAWAEPLSVRARRWLRRHRTFVAAASTAVAIALVSLTAGLLVVSSKNSLLEAANEREQVARNAAERNFDRSRMVVDEFLTEVSNSRELLRGAPGTQQLRQVLLAKAQDYYQQFLAENSDNVELKYELARSHRHLAHIHFVLGRLDESESTMFEALRLYGDVLAATGGESVDVVFEKVWSHNHHSSVLYRLGRFQQAVDELLEALRLADPFLADDKLASEHRETIILVQRNLAAAYSAQGRHEEACLLIDQAVDEARRHGLPPDVELVKSQGSVLYDSGRLDDAIAALQQVVQLLERENSGDPGPGKTLCDAYFDLAVVLERAQRLDEAFQAYETAISRGERDVAANPLVPEFKDSLAQAYSGLATQLTNRGRYDDAMRNYESAFDLIEQLVEVDREVPGYLQTMSARFNNVGVILLNQGRLAEAGESFHRAIEILEELHERQPQWITFLQAIVQSHVNLGEVLRQTGKLDDAMEAYERAIAAGQQVESATPDNVQNQEDLAKAYMGAGLVHTDRANWDAANATLESARVAAERLGSGEQRGRDQLVLLAMIHNNLGLVASRAGDMDTAERHYRRSLEATAHAVDLAPEIREGHRLLVFGQYNLGELLLERNQPTESAVELSKAREAARRWLIDNESDNEFRLVLLATERAMAGVLSEIGDVEAARQAYRDAIAIGDQLIKDRFGSTDLIVQLALALDGLGESLANDDPQEAVSSYKRGAAYLMRLVDLDIASGRDVVVLATIHRHWAALLLKRNEIPEALGHYDAALKQLRSHRDSSSSLVAGAIAKVLRAWAWTLATHPRDDVRDGTEAMRMATEACELDEWTSARFLATLAAAAAESGDFAKAVEYQQRAVELYDEEDRPLQTRRLDQFRRQQPLRDPPSP